MRSIQEVAQICLRTVAGWQVVTAGSGSEGLSKGGRAADAILDVMMPDMDGPIHKSRPILQLGTFPSFC